MAGHLQPTLGAAEPGSLTGGVEGHDPVDPTLEAGGTVLALGGGIQDVFTLWTLSPDDTRLAEGALEVAERKRRAWNEGLVDDLISRLSAAREPRSGA